MTLTRQNIVREQAGFKKYLSLPEILLDELSEQNIQQTVASIVNNQRQQFHFEIPPDDGEVDPERDKQLAVVKQTQYTDEPRCVDVTLDVQDLEDELDAKQLGTPKVSKKDVLDQSSKSIVQSPQPETEKAEASAEEKTDNLLYSEDSEPAPVILEESQSAGYGASQQCEVLSEAARKSIDLRQNMATAIRTAVVNAVPSLPSMLLKLRQPLSNHELNKNMVQANKELKGRYSQQ